MTTYTQLQQRAYQNKLRSYKRMVTKKNSMFVWKEDIDSAYKLIPNTLRINIHNTLNHELAKSKLLWLLRKQNLECYTEVIFKSKGRCDVLVPDTLTIYEVLETETIDEFKKKLNYYPELFHVVPYYAEHILHKNFNQYNLI